MAFPVHTEGQSQVSRATEEELIRMIYKVPSPKANHVRVVFELPASLQAIYVVLVADFNGWDPSTTPLGRDRDGVWRAVVDLPLGQCYEFRYLIDGNWHTDYHADGLAANAYGSYNSVVLACPATHRPERALKYDMIRERPRPRPDQTVREYGVSPRQMLRQTAVGQATHRSFHAARRANGEIPLDWGSFHCKGGVRMRKHKVLIPMDGSEFSHKIVSYVQEHLGADENDLTLLRVVEKARDEEPSALARATSEIYIGPYPLERELAQKERAEEADEALESLISRFRGQLRKSALPLEEAGYKVSLAVEFGDPAEEIVRFVAANDIDLVAMTTHGRAGLQRLVFGSVAGAVLRNVSVPILLLRPFD